MGKKEIIDFQNDLRRLAGEHSDIQSISKNLIDYIRSAFAIWRENYGVPDDILDVMEQVFLRSAQFRHNVLQGGAHLEDLLSTKENLLRILREMIPGVIVNTEMHSWTHKPEMGIGVALNWLASLQEVTDAVIEGDQPCSYHIHAPRLCAADPIPLCSGIQAARHLKSINDLHCNREEALQFFYNMADIKEIRWSNSFRSM